MGVPRGFWKETSAGREILAKFAAGDITADEAARRASAAAKARVTEKNARDALYREKHPDYREQAIANRAAGVPVRLRALQPRNSSDRISALAAVAADIMGEAVKERMEQYERQVTELLAQNAQLTADLSAERRAREQLEEMFQGRAMARAGVTHSQPND